MPKTQLKNKEHQTPIETLYCYLRVSTQSQIDEGHSIENQRATGKKVAKQLDMNYIEMNEGACSSKAEVYRPVYEDIKSRISKGEIKHLWVMNRNRWNRDMLEDMLPAEWGTRKRQLKC